MRFSDGRSYVCASDLYPAVIRQNDDMLTVIGDRFGVRGVDDDRPIMAELFLKARVAVIPIGPRLDDRKFVDEGRSGPDPWKADARNPVHLEGQDQPVPVDRTVLVEVVDDGQACGLTLLQPDQR